MRLRTLRPALLACSLLAPAAQAQSYSDPGVGGGGHLELSREQAGSLRLSGGAQVRARLTGGLGIEGLVAWRSDEHEVAGERVLSLLQIPVQGSVMLFFLYRTPVQPYLLGGIGYYYIRASGEGSNSGYGTHSESKFGFHGGAGVEARLAPKISLHADARYASVDVDAINALKTRYGVARRGGFLHATVGVTFYF